MIRMFGRTEAEILKALYFWDNHHAKPIIPCCDCGRLLEENEKCEYKLISECVKRFEQCRKDRIKITREEATEKLLNLGFANGMLIPALEALGLIKFDEPVNEGEQILLRARAVSNSLMPSKFWDVDKLLDIIKNLLSLIDDGTAIKSDNKKR